MSSPVNKPCIFCGGKYEKLAPLEGYEDHEISALVVNKIGTEKMGLVDSIVFHCTTCGNIQSFVKRLPNV